MTRELRDIWTNILSPLGDRAARGIDPWPCPIS